MKCFFLHSRKLFNMAVLFTAFGMLAFNLQSSSAVATQIGSVTFLLGGPNDIQIQHAGQTGWEAAKLKMPILDGDYLKSAAESRCEVKLIDGTVVRIGENTSFQFTQVNIKEKQRQVKAEVQSGQVWVNLPKEKSSKNSFQIKAPTAVCAVRGTIYRVDADSTTKCVVYDGVVAVGPVNMWGKPVPRTTKSLQPYPVQGPSQVPGPYQVSLEQWQQIVKGYQIVVRQDGKYAKEKIDEKKDADLDWVRWNKEQDAKVIR